MPAPSVGLVLDPATRNRTRPTPFAGDSRSNLQRSEATPELRKCVGTCLSHRGLGGVRAGSTVRGWRAPRGRPAARACRNGVLLVDHRGRRRIDDRRAPVRGSVHGFCRLGILVPVSPRGRRRHQRDTSATGGAAMGGLRDVHRHLRSHPAPLRRRYRNRRRVSCRRRGGTRAAAQRATLGIPDRQARVFVRRGRADSASPRRVAR
jgi:hypothetical protein